MGKNHKCFTSARPTLLSNVEILKAKIWTVKSLVLKILDFKSICLKCSSSDFMNLKIRAR